LKQESAKPGDAEDFWRRVTHGIVLDNIDWPGDRVWSHEYEEIKGNGD
jgi:hypothetical protein